MLGLRRKPTIGRLGSGGLITNYYCTSRCGHCLYACSSQWERRYIDEPTVRANFKRIAELGCNSVHVGGGEPFLDIDGLRMVLRTAAAMRMNIEYVETNSSWYRDADSAREVLESLRALGLTTVLVSISPFHNEYIPFRKVKGVIEACHMARVSVFPWIMDFYSEIDSLDDSRTHGISEYEERFGNGYLKNLPSRYWIHLGGRAISTFSSVYPGRPLRQILSSARGGCRELTDVSHFHFDLFGNYIPGLCSGLAIRREDLGSPLSADEYPLLSILFQTGIAGLLETASQDFGFEPAHQYLNKCHLCLHIRRFLVVEKGLQSKELQPRGFYDHVKRDALKKLRNSVEQA